MAQAVSAASTWLRRLRFIGIVLPVSAIIAFQVARPIVADSAGDESADLVIGVLSIVAVIIFGVTMFALLGRGYRLIEHQNRELSGTNMILTRVAAHAPLADVVELVRTHLVDLLDADDANVALTTFPHRLSPQGEALQSTKLATDSTTVTLRGSHVGTVEVHRRHALDDRERRLLETAADMISLAVAQAAVLEQERHAARVDELDRIARELHDSLAQVLGTLHLRLRAIPDPIEDHAAHVRDEVDALGDLCHNAYQDVREAITGLRSLTRSEESFTQAVTTYATHYSRLGGPETVLDLGSTELELDPASRLHLLRIIQEALTNVRKHALAHKVRITLRDLPDGHHLLVEDDGQGFDTEIQSRTRAGYGLDTMRERSTLIGATLEVQSAPGAGTRVSIHIPPPTSRDTR